MDMHPCPSHNVPHARRVLETSCRLPARQHLRVARISMEGEEDLIENPSASNNLQMREAHGVFDHTVCFLIRLHVDVMVCDNAILDVSCPMLAAHKKPQGPRCDPAWRCS